MKGIPSLSERYNTTLKRVQALYHNLEETQENLEHASQHREAASIEYNKAMNDLQVLLLLHDIKEGRVTVNDAKTGKRINIAFI